MAEKRDIVEQSNIAFDFIDKLFLEVSYLLKEIEGILIDENEKFVIGKPSGYGISARSSTGLEPTNVALWLMKKFAVFFVAEDKTEIKSGQTKTPINDDLKLLYLRIVLKDKLVNEPTIYSGVLFDVYNKNKAKWITKFEHVMSHIEYNDIKCFQDKERVDYEDSYVKLKMVFVKNKLFEINNSDSIRNKIIEPSLRLYREH